MLDLLGKGKRRICDAHTVCNKHFLPFCCTPKGGAPPKLPRLLVGKSIIWFDYFSSNAQSHVIVITVMDAVYHFRYYSAVGNTTF